MPQFKAKNQVARKDHVCDWCDGKILKGETYFYQCGVYDGDFSALKYHLRCNDTVNHVIKEAGIRTYDLAELQDLWHDMRER